jgi:hypothetical protein
MEDSMTTNRRRVNSKPELDNTPTRVHSVDMATNTPPPAVATAVPGTGRGCKSGREVPSKRLRNWHRRDRLAGGKTSLKAYARFLVRQPGSPAEVAIARRWMTAKGMRP